MYLHSGCAEFHIITVSTFGKVLDEKAILNPIRQSPRELHV